MHLQSPSQRQLLSRLERLHREVVESGDCQLQLRHQGAKQDKLKLSGADFNREIYRQNGRMLSVLRNLKDDFRSMAQ